MIWFIYGRRNGETDDTGITKRGRSLYTHVSRHNTTDLLFSCFNANETSNNDMTTIGRVGDVVPLPVETATKTTHVTPSGSFMLRLRLRLHGLRDAPANPCRRHSRAAPSRSLCAVSTSNERSHHMCTGPHDYGPREWCVFCSSQSDEVKVVLWQQWLTARIT